MESFEQIWESSRTNEWSWVYPCVLWSGVVMLITLSLVRNAWVRMAAKIVAIVALTVVATEYSAHEIREKWRIRGEWAKDHPTLMTPAIEEAIIADGANLTLGPLFRGFLAFALFVCVAFALSGLRFMLSSIRERRVGDATQETDSQAIRPASLDEG